MKWETKYKVLIEKHTVTENRLRHQGRWVFFSISKPPSEIEFMSYLQLVNYFSMFNEKDLRACSKIPTQSNSMLRRVRSVTETGSMSEKIVTILDSEGRNIYGLGFVQDVLNWNYCEEIESERVRNWQNRNAKRVYDTRGVCVPGTRKRKYGCRGPHRGLSNVSILRDNDAHAEWVRGSRSAIDNWIWQDPKISRARSWKDTTRMPKQWMRGVQNRLPSRGKGMFQMDYLESEFDSQMRELQTLEEMWDDTMRCFDSMTA